MECILGLSQFQGLLGDKNSEIPLTKQEYRCDLMCVFFFFSPVPQKDDMLRLSRWLLVFNSTCFSCQLLFQESSENYNGCSVKEGVQSVELDLFLGLSQMEMSLLSLEFCEWELARTSLEPSSSWFQKGRSSSEQSFSVDQLRQDEFSEKSQPSQVSSQLSLASRKVVGLLVMSFNSPTPPAKLFINFLLLEASTSQRLKHRSVARSEMKSLSRQKLILCPLTNFMFSIKYQFWVVIAERTILWWFFQGGNVNLLRETTNYFVAAICLAVVKYYYDYQNTTNLTPQSHNNIAILIRMAQC